MEHNIELIRGLLIEKLTGTISEQDNLFLESALCHDADMRRLQEELTTKYRTLHGDIFFEKLNEDNAWQTVKGRIITHQKESRKIRRLLMPLGIAATLLVVCVAGWFFVFNVEVQDDKIPLATKTKGIELQLPYGETIELSTDDRKVIDKGAIRLSANGKVLSYSSTGTSADWSTLVIPQTHDYKIVLSDGTEVSINSASVLKFPLSFADNCREVYLEGEAFFKVAKNRNSPFIVHTKNVNVTVLGTSFNLNSYKAESITSVVEGSVLASSANNQYSSILKPGYQMVFSGTGRPAVIPFDESTELSWIEGVEYFHNEPLGAIAEVIPRWFNIQVVFRTRKLREERFSGAIVKGKPLQELVSNINRSSDIRAYLKDNVLYVE